MVRSILSRKRDLAYLVFFLIHIPIIFCVDITPLYPASIKPQFMIDLRQWYITTYRDQFFVSPPAWFTLYMWLELFYHVPLSVWVVGGLLRDDPKVPVHLLAYAMQTAITTATCIADYLSWSGFSNAEKIELGKLYVPYLALSVFMGVDMFGRLSATLTDKVTVGSKKRYVLKSGKFSIKLIPFLTWLTSSAQQQLNGLARLLVDLISNPLHSIGLHLTKLLTFHQ